MNEVPSLEDVQDSGDAVFREPGQSVEEDAPDVVLTPDETQVVEEAIFLGRKEKIVSVMGHDVYIKTLTVNEELQLALLVKDWEGTQGYNRAFKAAVVSASVQEIDGVPLYQPISSAPGETSLVKRFEKVKDYYPVFIDLIYKETLALEDEMGREILPKLGK